MSNPTITPAIECPNCKKVSARRATSTEVRPLLDLLIAARILADVDENGMYLLLCPECGWFDAIHSYPTWQDWYATMFKIISGKKK